ncbi:MAG TPA: hypothetical protein VGH89_29025 [Pseudonocardia sp.]
MSEHTFFVIRNSDGPNAVWADLDARHVSFVGPMWTTEAMAKIISALEDVAEDES